MVAAGDIFRGRSILITGHTGFKGSWLALWLHRLGARITGIALDPVNQMDAFNAMGISEISDDIRQDISDFQGLLSHIRNARPEIVFHLAAQSLVLKSYNEPLYTFNTNITGTANVLEACRQAGSVKVIIVITTDKVYENNGSGEAFTESDRLGGDDPYSASKAAAEVVTRAYRASFLNAVDIAAATVRAGNVIGGGDWAENRIVPDCVRALTTGMPVEIRNPAAVRPWQHVLEPLGGYLLLAGKMLERSKELNEAWNFGPGYEGNKTVREVVEEFISNWGEGSIIFNTKNSLFHEAEMLSLNTDKARIRLGWSPLLSFEESVKMTAEWYKAQIVGKNMRDFSMDQIKHYEELMP